MPHPELHEQQAYVNQVFASFLGVSCERVSVPLAHTCHQSDAKYIDGTCGADLLKVGTRKPTTICVLIIIILRPSKTGGTGVISMKINY